MILDMVIRVVTTTEYTDDLDGSTAAGKVIFGFEGNQYEIDLSKSNARTFERAMKPYIDAARKVRGSRRSPARGRGGSRRDLASIREWAKANGHNVSDRGRIARDVVAAYDASR